MTYMFKIEISLAGIEIPVCKEQNLYSKCRYLYLRYNIRILIQISALNGFEPKQIVIPKIFPSILLSFYSKYSVFNNQNDVRSLQMSNI